MQTFHTFTLLDVSGKSPTLVLIEKDEEETGTLLRYEGQKLQSLYKQGGAAYGSGVI